jgi:hypothetical protein
MLSTANDVTSAADWPLTGLLDGPCGTSIYPMGVELVRGTNLSAASTNYLVLFSGPTMCPNQPSQIPGYVFKADSQLAQVAGYYYGMNATIRVGGYWTWDRANPSANPVFHPFEPGIYTVVAGDEWGDVVLLHFTVA